MKQEIQTELSSIAYEWLTNAGNKINKDYCRQEITTHPDYPALTSLTDFLESGSMAYDAVQADASYIHEFNYPLLGHIKKPGNEYLHLIKDATMWDKEKSITENWSGIALYAVKGATWHNEENNVAEKKLRKNKYTSAAFATAGIALLVVSIFLYPETPINIFGIFSFVGLGVSVAALGTELGFQSKVVKQVCGTVGNGGCEKVLGSKFAKGFAGITPADASVLYFAAQFVLYIIGCFYNPILTGLIIIAFSGILVSAWSIYTQAVKVKEWCALCLCILGVLMGQIIIAIYLQFNGLIFLLPNTQLLIPFVTFIITILLLTLTYLPIKQLVETNTRNKQELTSFKKWKTDASLFIAQWGTQSRCNNEIWENDLIIGNKKAPIRITVACNPFCSPCAKAHFKLEKILENYPTKVCIQIRILCNSEDENSLSTIAAKNILQVARKTRDNNVVKEMLTDWFYLMNLEQWKNKWQKNELQNEVLEDLKHHEKWIKESNIKFTPTFFVNGKMLPNRYDLKSFEKILPQLEENFV